MRLATEPDLLRYYGSRPAQTIRAYIGYLGNEPIGIVGLARERHLWKFFSEFKPEIRPLVSCISVMRAIKAVMAWAAHSSLPVLAVVQEDEPDSPRLLERLGFRYRGHGTYVYMRS